MSNQWCRRRGCRGCKRTPKSLDLLKIRAKSLKMLAIILKIFGKFPENLSKIPKYLGKIRENRDIMAPNIVWLQKTGSQGLQKNTWRPFWETHHKNGGQKFHDNFLGKFAKIWAKMLCTPKNLLAPTSICQTINNGSTTSWYTGTFAYWK